MATITALEPQVHDPERVNVYLDGEFALGASLLVVTARGLHVGQELGDEELESLRHDEAVEKAASAALNFLSFRPRSKRELADYLRRRQVEPEVAAAVEARLARVGLIDDREFAQFWVENRRQFRPRGVRALRQELRQKGLESEVIDEALADTSDEERLAYEAAERKARALARLDEREFHRRLGGFLQRRGFGYETTSRVTRRLWSELNGEESEV